MTKLPTTDAAIAAIAADPATEAEAAAAITTARSVVTASYKAKYAAREAAMTKRPKGVSRKALARSNGDWLATELAKVVLDQRSKLVVSLFCDVLTANGVRHEHWSRTTPGWQGRLRMTGRLALQRVVAESGELVLPDGTTIAAPRSWVAKHAN